VSFSLQEYLDRHRPAIETSLAEALPPADTLPVPLLAAMRYAVLGNGKRLRPMLVLAACEAVGGSHEPALPPALAVELIHAYSLVHDDLPALDDDDLRRGSPTTHRAYDEATAVLVGDALQTTAFEILTGTRSQGLLSEPVRLAMVARLAPAIGVHGMVGGQALDLALEGRTDAGVEELRRTHRLKTGALLQVSVELGGLAGGADDTALEALGAFGGHMGLAFQIVDDVLDVEASTEELGKTAGADAAHHKATYPGLLGLDEAKDWARRERDAALAALEPLGETAEPLRALARYIIDRTY
jgi:geranylgeranyl pyrophosphate synthase